MAQPITDKILVFDIGGTNLRAAIYDAEKDTLSRRIRVDTPNYLSQDKFSGEEIIERVFTSIRTLTDELSSDSKPKIVSLAFAGTVDQNGNILSAPTIWGDLYKSPVPMKKNLNDLWPDAQIFISNDMTASGYRYVTNQEDESFCIITVSSGIGLKFFLQGHPITGLHGRGGEIGHVRVDFSPNPPICNCGGKGHLEAVASGRATVYQAKCLYKLDRSGFERSLLSDLLRGDIEKINNKAIVKSFIQRDPWTIRLIQEIARPLGRVLGTVHLTVGTERFIIIGGLALALGEDYRSLLVEAAEASTWHLSGDWNEMIKLGKLDDDSALIGAGRLAK